MDATFRGRRSTQSNARGLYATCQKNASPFGAGVGVQALACCAAEAARKQPEGGTPTAGLQRLNVAFRSAKGRSFAERKATLPASTCLPNSSRRRPSTDLSINRSGSLIPVLFPKNAPRPLPPRGAGERD